MNTVSPQRHAESSTTSTLADQFRSAAASSRSSSAVHDVIAQLWRANAEGLVTDEEAQRIAEEAQGRRREIATTRRTTWSPPARSKPKRHCRSPDAQRSLERARVCARSRDIPDTIAQHYELKEAAALAIVAGELRSKQVCTLPIDAIAARSGGSRSTVKRAMRKAEFLGHLDVKERRIPGRKNETNVVRLTSLEWTAYLRWEGIGVHRRTTTGTPIKNMAKAAPKPPPAQHAIVLEKPFNELTRAERADLLRRTIGKLCA